MLLLNGATICASIPATAGRLAARVRERSGKVVHIEYPDLSHMRIVGALASPFRNWAPVLDDVVRSIRAHEGAHDAARSVKVTN